MQSTEIQYLERSQIDQERWDQAIRQASNSLLYAHSFYLDHMADHWGALAKGDYEVLMPIPYRKKWGIKYLAYVPFVQQLGIFAANDPDPATVESFLKQVKERFAYGDVYLNYANQFPASAHIGSNYILPLDTTYETMAAAYKGDLKRNLEKAQEHQLLYTASIELPVALDLFRQHYQSRMAPIRPVDYARFGKLCEQASQKGQLLLRGIQNKQGQWLATALLLKDDRRLYLLQSTTLAEGRKPAANHYLLDQLIREWAGTGYILDFEGSDIPGIAHFYSNFGSSNQPYSRYFYNELPWWIKWMKR